MLLHLFSVTIISIAPAVSFSTIFSLFEQLVYNTLKAAPSRCSKTVILSLSLDSTTAIYFIESGQKKRTFLAKAKEKEAKDPGANRDVQNILRRKSLVTKNFRRDRINLILRLSVRTDSREFIGHATADRSSNIHYGIESVLQMVSLE